MLHHNEVQSLAALARSGDVHRERVDTSFLLFHALHSALRMSREAVVANQVRPTCGRDDML
jgi:hypothetical protein